MAVSVCFAQPQNGAKQIEGQLEGVAVRCENSQSEAAGNSTENSHEHKTDLSQQIYVERSNKKKFRLTVGALLVYQP